MLFNSTKTLGSIQRWLLLFKHFYQMGTKPIETANYKKLSL